MELSTVFWSAGAAVVFFYVGYRFGVRVARESSSRKDGKLCPVAKTNCEQAKESSSSRDEIPARECFVKNLSLFEPLLDGIYIGNMDSQKWMEIVVSLNNQGLTRYCQAAKGNAKSWLTILQMWGINYDPCGAFTCIDVYKEMYMLQDGSELDNDVKYKVLSPCWILTEMSEGGKSKKTLVKKGIVIAL